MEQSAHRSAPIIELKGVSFRYRAGAPLALDDVSLAVAEGDFLGVIGPSGAGKSTLAAVMSGAIPHHFRGELYGAALVEGRDTCEVTLTDISRLVGSVLQDIDAQMVASVVEDELLFGLENFGVPHGEIEGRLAEALETVGIADLRDREIATLSGGQKQKVAIAAILALRPRVLVMDEPTAALDPESSRTVFETLARVNERAGVTVVVIEQKVALLSRYCRRIAVMGEGRVALSGAPREVFSHAEELRALGVDSPRVARVSNSLRERGLVPAGTAPCLRVDEAVELIAGLVGEHDPTPGSAGAPESGLAATSEPGAPAEPGVGSGGEEPPAFAKPSVPVVSLENVSFSYGRDAVVSDLSLEVRAGELVGVVGQNGAGKTTLTKLLCGLLRPSAGTVRVGGLSTAEVPTSAIAAHVATLFQNPDRQLCRDTVLDEVAFGLELQGVDAGAARERARAVAERFGLPLGESPFSLSRGQRQMVALASVVVMEPEVVLLDEPTSGLDYRECMTVMETVQGMAERGCAVIMVCHDMEVVSDFAERLAVMARGRILATGPARELFADEGLMRRASVEAPQVTRLARALASRVSPRYGGVREVAEVVQVTEELMNRG